MTISSFLPERLIFVQEISNVQQSIDDRGVESLANLSLDVLLLHDLDYCSKQARFRCFFQRSVLCIAWRPSRIDKVTVKGYPSSKDPPTILNVVTGRSTSKA